MMHSTASGSPPPNPAFIPAFGLWLALTLVLALACIGLAIYLQQRVPEVVEVVGPTPPAVLSPDLQERADGLRVDIVTEERALNEALDALENPSCPIPEVLDPGLWRDIQREEAPNLDLWRALIGRSAPPLRERLLPSGQGALGQTAPSGQQDQAPSLPSPNARSQDTGQADQTAPQTDPTLTESLPEPQGEPHGNPDQTGTLESLSNRDLGALLESATVFVLGLDPDGEDASTGSGFFISERLIVTNRHVIEDADQNYLLVTSARMGTVQKARLVATSPSSDIGGEDFAVLALEDGRAPGFVALAQEDRKLTEVVAAGYPGLSLRGDEGFSRLVEGDLTAAPDLNMNSGEIRSLQSLGEINRIVHTADVLKGNSGGPLFDRCGRVIGVNTFVQVDKDQAGRLNNAIETGDLLAFLARHGLSASVDQRTCAP